MNPRHVRIWILATPLLWGLVFVGVNRVLQYTDAFQLVTLRFMLIAILFSGYLLAVPKARPRMTRRDWGLAWIAGLLAVPLSQLPIVYSQNFLHPTLASLLVTTAPAAAAILGPLFLTERVNLRQASGFLVAFAGAAVVIVGGAGGASVDSSSIFGAGLGLITPVAWALYTILLKRLSTGDPFVTVGVGLVLGTVFLIPWIPTSLSVAGSIPLDGWLWIIYLALFGTFTAYLIWFRALRVLDANQTAAYMYLVPIAALIWSLIVLGEGPPLVALPGGALIFIGLFLIQSRSTSQIQEAV
ncbi:MAG: DMT family transporter [bacterium]|nr:DMT family transporter [bacterium]